MKPSTVLLLSCFLSACGVARPVLDQDNTKVEVKTVVERVVDTAYVPLPMYVDRVETLDTLSRLENRIISCWIIRNSSVNILRGKERKKSRRTSQWRNTDSYSVNFLTNREKSFKTSSRSALWWQPDREAGKRGS